MTDKEYNKEHDAYFDPETNEWLEPKCKDKDCEYCADRPEYPPETSALEMCESYEFDRSSYVTVDDGTVRIKQEDWDKLQAEVQILKENLNASEKFINNLSQEKAELLECLRWFCDRVNKGEVRSTKTYNKFKQLLNKHKVK